jgi:hypothetical protein
MEAAVRRKRVVRVTGPLADEYADKVGPRTHPRLRTDCSKKLAYCVPAADRKYAGRGLGSLTAINFSSTGLPHPKIN